MANERRTLKKDWSLNQEAFDGLMARLDADRDRAGEKYEQLRLRLVTMSMQRRCTHPEAAADETLDRVARRIQEGEKIRSTDFYAYVHGVAINVLKEYFRAQAKHPEVSSPSTVDIHQKTAAVNQDPAKAQLRLRCLKRCVGRLPPESRLLIREFYKGKKGVLIRNRRALASQIEIGANTLRTRAHRIRLRLEECVGSCLEDLLKNGQD